MLEKDKGKSKTTKLYINEYFTDYLWVIIMVLFFFFLLKLSSRTLHTYLCLRSPYIFHDIGKSAILV